MGIYNELWLGQIIRYVKYYSLNKDLTNNDGIH